MALISIEGGTVQELISVVSVGHIQLRKLYVEVVF